LCLNTVETYRKTISAKLGLSGVELVRAAVLHRCTAAPTSVDLSAGLAISQHQRLGDETR
jgi:hypothetical protein